MTAWAAWAPLLKVLALCMMRPLGVMALLSVTSTRMLGGAFIRNALALLIALPVMPAALTWAKNTAPPEGFAFAGMILSEFSVGLYIGLLAAIPFWAVAVAGEFIDTARGAGLAEILNPALGEEVSLFSLLFLQLLAALFFVGGGFNLLLAAIYQSYTKLPLGQALLMNQDTALFMIHQWRLVLELGVGFALPAVALMLLVDFSFGLINRTAGQLDVFFIAMPIKSIFACLALIFGLRLGLDHYLDRFDEIWLIVRRLLDLSITAKTA
ncbi:Type III escT secretion system protein [Mycoavidus cysteinexigens]|uniref:Type III escT secretion system protein n=1 Tax=Mycoavidus cysteinexigens TaxID=1553431 RepID=A0A2Z6ESH0_9BURK|nr:type III secretion system export apparatus subunit SctT [Mycoavidus cysteinexigens]BBE08356.1 Type III escT secretion system protein [Mycoavidus cysteinexigens]GAM52941.1 type III secretion inner membrane protein [bacterium endosymbiont of Mortierella elongata FMR23-6]GLR00862.1 EscT/YscT/HrcT family type III secretion system export apparatus protein [Mycoavidus cysteinexigens]